MIEGGSLVLAAAAIFLFECLVPVRRDAVVFLPRLGRRASPVDGSRLPGLRSIGWAFAFPLPPLGGVFVCPRWPLSLSPQAVCAWLREASDPGGRPPGSGEPIPFPAAGGAMADDGTLRLAGGTSLATGSPALATHLAALLGELAAQSETRRASAIERAIGTAFDGAAVDEALARHRRSGRPLRIACNATWLWLFVLAPAMLALRGLAVAWLPLLLGMAVLVAWTASELWIAHRRVAPGRRGERWRAVLTVLLAPPLAARAHDLLSRDLLATYHPVTVATALSRPGDALALATRTLREARHPLPEPAVPAAAEPTVDWFHQRWLAALERCIEQRLEVSPEELLRPPAPETPSSRLYCPRCAVQYQVDAAECSDCPGLALRPLGEPAVAAARR